MIYSFSPFGYEGALVTIETDLRRGIPATDIVGMSDKCVKEVRERVQVAIRNSGFEYPNERVLISLSPADLKKEGCWFDLPIALGVLVNQSVLYDSLDEDVARNMVTTPVLVMGELELSGRIRNVKAIHGACSTALASGIEYAIVPKGSDVPKGIKYCEVETLEDAYRAMLNIGSQEYFKKKGEEVAEGFSTANEPIFDDFEITDFDSLGNNGLKFALAVAVAGRHNLMAVGKPGCGKTMVLQHAIQLIPRLTFEESQSVTRIWSLAGLIKPNEDYIKVRPFRIPHQTASIEGICGGGSNCRPGEISLAHNGVLFLDESPEFRSSVLQMLRVPLENGTISLSRAGRSTVYPAKFQLFMTANPCPCGNLGSEDKVCLCSTQSVENYWKKFSAPLLDRVAIRYDCNFEYETPKYTLEELRKLIRNAWKVQYKRQGKLNSDLAPSEILEYIVLSKSAQEELDNAIKNNGYSPRAISSLLKVARTYEDMFLEKVNDNLVSDKAIKKAIELRALTPVGMY